MNSMDGEAQGELGTCEALLRVVSDVSWTATLEDLLVGPL